MDYSNPLNVLRSGHKEGLAILEQLVDILESIRMGNTKGARGKLKNLLCFFNKQLVVHFRQEEEVLFPALEKSLSEPGPVKLGGETPDICYLLYCDVLCSAIGPLSVYLQEHDNIRQCIQRLNDLAYQIPVKQAWPDDLAIQIELAGIGLETLLRSHITKEDEVLLPKAAEVMDSSLFAQFGEAMEEVAS